MDALTISAASGLRARMETLDMLANVSSWTQCFRHLGPLSGSALSGHENRNPISSHPAMPLYIRLD